MQVRLHKQIWKVVHSNFGKRSIIICFNQIHRYQHNLAVVAFTIPAHQTPVKTLALLKLPEGPKLLSGSTDKTVKVRTYS